MSSPTNRTTKCPEYLTYLGFTEKDCKEYPEVFCTAETKDACEKAVRALITSQEEIYRRMRNEKSKP